MSAPRRDEVIALLAGPIGAEGFDIDAVEVTAAGAKSMVRVIVDSDHGVGLDDIVDLTQITSDVLDVNDAPGGGPYTLEVTSRGVDRPLTEPRHFRRARGRRVRARIDGETVEGRVGPLDEQCDPPLLQLAVRGEGGPRVREVRLDRISRAQVQVEFGKPDRRELALTGEPAGPSGAAKEKDK